MLEISNQYHKNRRDYKMEEKELLMDKFRGCLVGGAAGDALGYEVEFMLYKDILQSFGEEGITSYALTEGKALVSDDTQMSMFTANGLLCAEAGFVRSEQDYVDSIAEAYKDWYQTQQYANIAFSNEREVVRRERKSWLMQLDTLFSDRAPGRTCLESIAKGCNGTIDRPLNQSKGCGGIMRVAPIGLYFSYPEKSARVAAAASALTHGHELGFIPSAALAYMITEIIENPQKELIEVVRTSLQAINKMFAGCKELDYFLNLMVKAVALVDMELLDQQAIALLGRGWVAEETLAIALYCALKHKQDFGKAIVAAVNHDGDSDSTGAVTGNLLGAYLGYGAIPEQFKSRLELHKELLILADDLYFCEPYPRDFEAVKKWQRKYIEHCCA